MSDPPSQAQIDAAQAYEALFVPALFGQWAPTVAGAARIRPGQRVLDVACGTGVLAREAASRTGAGGYVAGVDINPGMLTVARQRAPALNWRQGAAESLPFQDASFDSVVSQFGLMFFTDRQQSLREMRRVLAPGGQLAVAVWDALDNMPAFAAEVRLLEKVAGKRAADALRAPFALGHRRALSGVFADAGIAMIDLRTHQGTARFPSIRVMVEADLRGWLPVMGVSLDESVIERVLDSAEQALAAYVNGEGGVSFAVSAHIVTAACL